MDQRLSLVTLGVRDLAVARDFYEEGLGWKATSAVEGKVVFYQMNGMIISLFGRDDLVKDGNFTDSGAGFSGITLAYNARDAAEVDAVMTQAEKAGAVIQKPAEKVFWGGYSGYFCDLDGHPWEVAYNPFWNITEDGHMVIPQD